MALGVACISYPGCLRRVYDWSHSESGSVPSKEINNNDYYYNNGDKRKGNRTNGAKEDMVGLKTHVM